MSVDIQDLIIMFMRVLQYCTDFVVLTWLSCRVVNLHSCNSAALSGRASFSDSDVRLLSGLQTT